MKPDKTEKLQRDFEKLDRLYQAMRAEEARMDVVVGAVSAQLTRIALEKYPGLPDLDSDGIRKLGDLVGRTAGKFAEQLESLAATKPVV